MTLVTDTGFALGRVATYTDPSSRVREDATFVPAGGDELFCVVYHPVSTPRRGVVICSSVLFEQFRLYRTEVLAARMLAAQGFAVIRFHYRGTGHSGGATGNVTLESMSADTFRAAEFLGERTGAQSLAFCGIRWGGLVAGLAASEHAGIPLALWEPVIDGGQCFQEVFRAQQMSAVARGTRTMMRTPQILEEMRTAGYIDWLGYPIHLGLYESTIGRSLTELASGHPRPILLIQVSRSKQVKSDFAALRDSLVTGGWQVEPVHIRQEEGSAWLLPAGRMVWMAEPASRMGFSTESVPSMPALVQTTLGWLRRLDVMT